MTEETIKSGALDYSDIAPSKTFYFTAWLICALGAIYYCYEYLLRIAPSVMTQELMRVYHLTATELGVFSAYYYHAYVPMQIVVGLLMDRYGPRRLLTLACLFCAFGTFLFAGGYSLAIAEVGRFLVGFGSAFAFVGALKLATIWLPPNRFALISGMIMCLGMVGAMVGDILLRTFIDQFGWQFTIYGSAIAGVILTAVLWMVVRDARTVEQRSHHTMRFRELFVGLWCALKNPQIWLTGFVGLLLYLSLSAFAELWGIQYLEQAHGLSKTEAASANALVFLGWAIGSLFWGGVSDFIKLRVLPIIISSIICLIVIGIVLYVPNLSLMSLSILLFAFGIFSSAQILIFAIAREAMSLKIAGTVIALTNTIVMIGGNVFQPVIGKLLDMKWAGTLNDGVRVYSPDSYQFALSVLPIGVFLALVVLFFIRETYAKNKE